ncbi:2OG-Fe(II) oxygenase [uncultured Mucilaginibacter sp.]|uniref:2OG-Fe(II) oxygenase n=1 Tax=uncultured Mucilaginibacter sp. TaxID=797541 RepID=UPI0025D401E1|nr:2OG-Fe(II) oxygenase [uncultured Mucilaginibacter sp.]
MVDESFDELIDSYIATHIGISENFLGAGLALSLTANLERLFASNELNPAGTGNATLAVMDKRVRGDDIYWLDRRHNNTAENSFFDLMDRFVAHLNQSCYTGITGYEFHYTRYPGGSFYKKHLDQFENNSSRQYSMVMYLNADWLADDGGELCIHQNNVTQLIAPTNGRSVFFKSSELEHEVLLTQKPRLSITGWLKIN